MLYCFPSNKYYSFFIPGAKPNIPSEHVFFPLLEQFKTKEPTEGIIKDGTITWHYQLRLLPESKKLLLYFTDISSEYSLIKKLQDTRRRLAQKEKLLYVLNNLDTEKNKKMLQEHINLQIDQEVRLKLKHCLTLFDVSVNIDEVITILETSLSDIRHLVSKLANGDK